MPYRISATPPSRRWGVTKGKRAFVVLFRRILLLVGYWFMRWIPPEVFEKHFRPFLFARLRFLNQRIEALMVSSAYPYVRLGDFVRYDIHSQTYGSELRQKVRVAVKERDRYTDEPYELSEGLAKVLKSRMLSSQVTFVPESKKRAPKGVPTSY